MSTSPDSAQFKVVNHNGQHDVTVQLSDYREAEAAGMNLTQFVNRKFGESDKGVTAMAQMAAQVGLTFGSNKSYGIKPPSMHDVMNDNTMLSGGIVRPDGSASGVGARLLFPEILMASINDTLSEDNGDFLNAMDRLVAVTHNVPGSKVDQPIINHEGTQADANKARPIAQGAEPAVMLKISVSDKSFRIPTYAIGLEVTKEALQSSSIDLVALAVMNQARFQRISMAEDSLSAIVNGNADLGETAISGVTAQSFDATITTAGNLTHKAYIKWLRANYRRRTLNWGICDIDTALALENRTGKPERQKALDKEDNFGVTSTVDNLAVKSLNLLLVDTDVIGANTLVAFDTRFAVQKFVNINASYEAIQEFVLRKTMAMRFDFAERYAKLYSVASEKLTLTV